MSRDGDACARTGCNLSRRQHEDVGEIDHEFTPPESRSVQGAECRHCSKTLLDENRWMADGCPCNSGRGINHGLVPQEVCTCAKCDPAKTGGSRYHSGPCRKPVADSPDCARDGHLVRDGKCRWCGEVVADSPKSADDALCISCGKQRPEQTVGCAECLGWLAGFNAGREHGRIDGVREGVELAKEHAWVCDHNGWHPISPCIEWEGVEKAIAALPIARSSKEVDRG